MQRVKTQIHIEGFAFLILVRKFAKLPKRSKLFFLSNATVHRGNSKKMSRSNIFTMMYKHMPDISNYDFTIYFFL